MERIYLSREILEAAGALPKIGKRYEIVVGFTGRLDGSAAWSKGVSGRVARIETCDDGGAWIDIDTSK